MCKGGAHKVIDQLCPIGSTALQGEDGLGAATALRAVALLPVPDLPAQQRQSRVSPTGGDHRKTWHLVQVM